MQTYSPKSGEALENEEMLLVLQQALTKKRVLIVDRHAPARESVRLMLGTLGVTQVHGAGNSAEVIRQVKANRFDIILSTANGTSYNAYLVRGEHGVAVIDTVKEGFADDFFRRLESVARYDEITTIVLNHLEPDHSGALPELLKRAPQAKVVRFDDEAASITAAATGQTDIVAITPPIIAAIAKRSPAREFEVKFILHSYQLAVAMRKDQPQLMAAVNGWIKTNLANGKLNEIHLKYAGVPIPDEIVNGAK